MIAVMRPSTSSANVPPPMDRQAMLPTFGLGPMRTYEIEQVKRGAGFQHATNFAKGCGLLLRGQVMEHER